MDDLHLLPDWLRWTGAVAAVLGAVGLAVKRAVVPVMRGLVALVRHGQEIVDGARAASAQLLPDSGTSLVDRVAVIEHDVTAIRQDLEATREQVEQIEGDATE